MAKNNPVPPGTTYIKGTDGSLAFDGQFIIITHAWNADAGRGEARYPLASVSGVDVKNGMMLAAVTVVVPGGVMRNGKNAATVNGISKAEAARFRNLVVNARAALDAAPAQAAPPAGAGLAEQLQKLGELRQQGLLSDDEFAAAKARLLGA